MIQGKKGVTREGREGPREGSEVQGKKVRSKKSRKGNRRSTKGMKGRTRVGRVGPREKKDQLLPRGEAPGRLL